MSAVTFEHGPAFGARAARPATRHGGAPAPLHLTPRGRRVVLVLAIVLALAVGLIGGRAMASAPDGGVAVDVYTVGAGETLWAIAAAQATPGQDVRDIISDLMSINELRDSALVAGQQILVPVTAD